MTENNEQPQNTDEQPQNTGDQPQPEPQPTQPTPAPEIPKEVRNWAMLCHLLGLGWLIVPPIGGIIGALVMWQIKKDEHPFVDANGKEALNFQISMLIYWTISLVLIAICVGAALVVAIGIADIVFALIAAVKAGDGITYRYPLTIRFVK